MMRHRTIDEFARFCAVGAASALLGFALLYLLTDVAHLHYLISFAVSFLGTNLLAFLANGTFSFRGRAASGRFGLIRYYVVSAASLVVNFVLLALLVEVAHWHYLLAAVALAAFNAPVNFLVHRSVTYRLRQQLGHNRSAGSG